ncbi:MAG: hypothetical protein AAFN30_02505, partial [Actinomycetota bacterium]
PTEQQPSPRSGVASSRIPAQRGEGCCSVGAELLDDDERRRISALGLSLDPDRFQYAEAAVAGGVLADADRSATRVVDGACIFLNRPGFTGGEGCALHLAAVDEGESPIDWKPSVCWQLPMKVDVDETGERTLRRWARADWGPGGQTMAWCCTEAHGPDRDGPDAYVGDEPVAVSLAAELSGLVGPELAAILQERATLGSDDQRRALGPRPDQPAADEAPSTASSHSDQ